MLKIEKFVTASPEQWEIIIEGMRSPKNSWDRMDTALGCINGICGHCGFNQNWCGCTPRTIIGPNDHKLMMQLNNGGPVHAKYRRMIPVWVTVTSNLVWWAEFDTYKVSTVRNSCSKMHKIHVSPFTIDNFSHEGCDEVEYAHKALLNVIDICEQLRQDFNRTQEKKYWRALIELLPEGYNMRATVYLNYETLQNIYHSRKDHKMLEWHVFCDWIKNELPYSELITGEQE